MTDIEQETQILTFQNRPVLPLADELYELGQKAIKEFNEPLFGEFLITQAFLYRTGKFQQEYIRVMETLEAAEEENLDEILSNIPIDKDKIM